jgi:uncharacterized protein (DUF488 family)
MSKQRTLYTLGYEKRTIGELVELLADSGIGVLVDVRETAWSHKPGFSKTAFAAALATAGIEYVHAPFAGNPKSLRVSAPDHASCLRAYRRYLERDGSIIERFEEVLTPHLRDGVAVCITCFERHADDCHRGILAEVWRCRGKQRRVEHLATSGCARLIPA